MTAADALDTLEAHRFLSLRIELQPVGQPTIQPPTFANTGASFYTSPEGALCALIESVASMANQLELAVWDEGENRPAASVEALPWVAVLDKDGDYYTSSRRAAHRLNAHSLWNGVVESSGETFESRMKNAGQNAKPPVVRWLAAMMWDHDPLAILHGCWFAGLWDGRARLTRALSGRIDAIGIQSQSVQVGGQKSADSLDEIVGAQARDGGKTVPGEVPHYTSEVSASEVVATIVLDVGLLRSYGLGSARERALVAVGVLQVAELVADWPRRRSRCILRAKGVSADEPAGWELPALDDLREACALRCREAADADRAEPLVVRWTPKAKAKTKDAPTPDTGDEPSVEA